MNEIALLLMASGQGKRFGSNKLLATLKERPLAEYGIKAASKYPFSEKLLVTIHPQVASLAENLGVPSLLHTLPGRGQAIGLGVKRLSQNRGILFCPCDQPFLKPESIKRLCEAFLHNPEHICRLCYGEEPGAVVIFPARCFDALCNLPEKAGGSYLIKKDPLPVLTVQAEDPLELFDIDTAEDLSFALSKLT